MKLKVRFKFITKEVNWWRNTDDFPRLINFMNKNWKFIGSRINGITHEWEEAVFIETNTWDPEHTTICSTWNELFPETVSGCECGAIHTSFQNHHMFYCRLWSKNQ